MWSCNTNGQRFEMEPRVGSGFTRSGQYPTSLMSDPRWRAVRGVCSAGLMTTVFPQLRAGAIFHMNISKGKFHWHRQKRDNTFLFSFLF